MKAIAKTALLITIIVSISCKTEVKTGYDIIHQMKSKYNSTWYKNFTFSQKVYHYRNDSLISKDVWHEAYSYPSQLIIKFSDFDSGNGIIFRNDSLYVFSNNEIVNSQKRIHDLILLGFDVYEQPAELSFEKMARQGYDLSKVHTTRIDNREVYCVGKLNKDERANAFYIDKEGLYFIKNIKHEGENYTETIFSDYKVIEGKPVATVIEFYRNGSLIMKEAYYNVQFPDTLDKSIFQASNFINASW